MTERYFCIQYLGFFHEIDLFLNFHGVSMIIGSIHIVMQHMLTSNVLIFVKI